MYNQTVLTTAVLYEIEKQRSVYALKATWYALEAGVMAFAEKWDEFYPEEEQPCTASIMCLREYKRHKAHCPLNRNYSDTCPKGKHFTCSRVHRSAN